MIQNCLGCSWAVSSVNMYISNGQLNIFIRIFILITDIIFIVFIMFDYDSTHAFTLCFTESFLNIKFPFIVRKGGSFSSDVFMGW